MVVVAVGDQAADPDGRARFGHAGGPARASTCGQGLCIVGEIMLLVSGVRRLADHSLWWIPGSSCSPVWVRSMIVGILQLYLLRGFNGSSQHRWPDGHCRVQGTWS